MIKRKGQEKLWPDPVTDTFSFEKGLHRKGHSLVAGLDEVGRGPLAGPVVAACVILPTDCDYQEFVDSKKITHNNRIRLNDKLHQIGAQITVGISSVSEIEQFNILQASLLAMKKAVQALSRQPDYLLVDGTFSVPVSIPQQTLTKGESKSASIAAASIVAKVMRDRMMEDYHQRFPAYNFKKNKGYPTAEHRKAIKEYGPCKIHRQTFKGVREHLRSGCSDCK